MESLPVTVTSATVSLPTTYLGDAWELGQALRSYAEKRAIVCDADLKPLTDDQTIIGKTLKDLDAQRKALTQPLDDEKKAIMAAFQDARQPLEQADALNRKALSAYHVEQERQAEEARKAEALKLAAAMQAGEVPETTAPAIPEVVKTVRTEMGTIGFRKHFAFEIVDAAALPRAYLMPDEKKIRAAVNAEIAIPGVRAYRDDTVTNRAR